MLQSSELSWVKIGGGIDLGLRKGRLPSFTWPCPVGTWTYWPTAPDKVRDTAWEASRAGSLLKCGNSCSRPRGMEEAKSRPLCKRRGEKAGQKRLQKMARAVGQACVAVLYPLRTQLLAHLGACLLTVLQSPVSDFFVSTMLVFPGYISVLLVQQSAHMHHSLLTRWDKYLALLCWPHLAPLLFCADWQNCPFDLLEGIQGAGQQCHSPGNLL